MSTTLYTTDCPKCKILKAKLEQKNIQYETISDIETMIEKGLFTVPVLEVDGDVMDFMAATKWVNERN